MSHARRYRRAPQLLAAAIAAAVACAVAPAAESRPGLLAVLENDGPVIAELVRRELTSLEEYLYEKNKVPPDQRLKYKSVIMVKRLDDPSLAGRALAEVVRAVALGVDNVIPTLKTPEEMLNLAATLTLKGAARPLNLLEYWGEEARTQAELRPVAEAVVKLYQAGVAAAEQKRQRIESQITAANQAAMAKVWQDAENLVVRGRYNMGCAHYPLALSIDRADPKRVEVCQAGIGVLREYESPDYEIVAAAKIMLAKLSMAMGTREGISEAKEKLQEVLKDRNATWPQQFEARYFTAVADLLDRNLAGARADLAALEKFVQGSQAPGEDVRKGATAALEMLRFRIFSVEEDIASATAAARAAGSKERKEAEAAARAANAAALKVLGDLQKARPDLSGIINQQMIARLPEQPDVKELNAVLLQAMVSRAFEEVRKPPEQKADAKAINQGIMAAEEIVRRAAASRDGLTAKDADEPALALGFFHERLNNDSMAAHAFITHIEKFPQSQFLNDAYQGARAAVYRLMTSRPAEPDTRMVYERFLAVVTAPPLSRAEFFFEYGDLLLRRIVNMVDAGRLTQQQKKKAIEDLVKAVAMFQRVPDPNRRVYAKFREMVALDAVIDLAPDAPNKEQYVQRIRTLAGEVMKLIDEQSAAATDQAIKENLRAHRVKAILLVADLAKHDRSMLEQSVQMTADAEKLVEGMPNADAMLAGILYNRVNALLALGRTDDALSSLRRFVEKYPGEQGLEIIIRMIEALRKEFDEAKEQNNEPRMDELSGHIARVSRYLVETVEQSKDARIRDLLPRYRMFEASSRKIAGDREKDPEKKKEHYRVAMNTYGQLLKEAKDEKLARSLRLAIAMLQYDSGEYLPAQQTFGELVSLVGKPYLPGENPGEPPTPNRQYWEIMYKLLRSIAELCKAKAAGFDERALEDVKTKLKQLYIVHGREPGGPAWGPRFDELRKELMPDWTPPAADQTPATQPAAG